MLDGSSSTSAETDSESLYRAMFLQAAEGIFRTDSDGRVRLANPAFARLFGYDTPQALIETVGDFAVDLALETGPFRAVLTEVRAGRQVQRDLAVKRRGGEEFWIEINARPVTEGERFLYVEGSAVDISRRKNFEAELLAAKERADVAARTRTEFLGNMSHELRTPLNAIIGFAEIIKSEMMGPLGHSDYRDYANDIYESGRHLLEIINDILDVVKIEAGKRELNESLLDVERVLTACLRMAQPKAETAAVTLVNDIEPGLPALRGEELAFKQILTNLLSNAVKFTPAGGSVTLHAGLDVGGGLTIAVADTGIGIAPENIEKVLRPFSQVSADIGRSHDGTGLGLTLVKSLVELHGGTFTLESVLGQGTTAKLWLPSVRLMRAVA
jgi:PAS domain S-box-containing protein